MNFLRHLTFPTPILDWTENFNIAVFFAIGKFDSLETNQFAVIRLKTTQPQPIFGIALHKSKFDFNLHFRHFRHFRHFCQKSIYTLALQQDHIDTVLPPSQREGPRIPLNLIPQF